jgi:glutamate dehydrogenase
VPDDPYLHGELDAYFPRQLVERFADTFDTHRLRREIISTMLANAMIDGGGPTLVTRMVEQTGAATGAIARAFAIATNALRLPELVAGVDGLDTRIPAALQTALYTEIQDLLMSRMIWILRNGDPAAEIGAMIARFRSGADAIAAAPPENLGAAGAERRRARSAELQSAGVPADLAERLAALPALEQATDAVVIAEATGCPLDAAAGAIFAVAEWLGLGSLRARAAAYRVSDVYERLAIDRSMAAIGTAERQIAIAVIRAGSGDVAQWALAHADAARLRETVAEIARTDFTLARLTVVAGLLADLAGRDSLG